MKHTVTIIIDGHRISHDYVDELLAKIHAAIVDNIPQDAQPYSLVTIHDC